MLKPNSRLRFMGLAACLGLPFTPSAVRVQQAEPAPPPVARSHLRQVLPRRVYLCASGASVVVLLEPNAMRLTFNGKIHNMKQVESASGTKYSDGMFVWFINGDDGYFEDDSVPGKPGVLAKDCHLQSAFPPVAPAAGIVTGTLRYSKQAALPTDAVVIVELEDIFLADAPSPTIAKYESAIGNGQQPIHFTLKFDPSKIDPKHPYAVRAGILVGGQLCAASDKQYLVLTLGHPSNVDLGLVRSAPAPTKP